MKKFLVVAILMKMNFAIASEEIKVGVKGMVCSFCAQGIDKKFKAEPEVESVDVSLSNKFVKLKFKDGKRLSNEKIEKILKDSGYEVSFENTSGSTAQDAEQKK